MQAESQNDETILENDPDKEKALIDKVFEDYEGKENISNTQYHLQESFKTGALACLICIENLERVESIWNCQTCYASFHLACIQKWAKDSVFSQTQVLEEQHRLFQTEYIRSDYNIIWSCPKCRFNYPERDVPNNYFCFCGKVKEPAFDPWIIPHSCGEKCKKSLKPECGHRCLLLCHPGPCPPCAVMVKYNCYCSKSSETRRCSSKYWGCNGRCNKLLDCILHKCKEFCHSGDCKSCDKVTTRKCQCGRKSEARRCSNINWQCGAVCGKLLICGLHYCERVCHKDDCGECPGSKERSCPCGKQFSTLPCTEAVPSCGDTCDKMLLCTMHTCDQRCHKGTCPACLQFVTKRCRCGLVKKEVPCSKFFKCDSKCKKMRDCRKHTCNIKCCMGDCSSCEIQCGKILNCGNHRCNSRCHFGRCFPCQITKDVRCVCSKTIVTVPCGMERKVPTCNKPCRRTSNCHHRTQGGHDCHLGKCPPCKRNCYIRLSCKHRCKATCHDAVPIKVGEKRKPAGPWEMSIFPEVKITKLDCPPCQEKVPGTCLGLHETSEWVCSDLIPHSCGRLCGRQLSCGNHTCEKECHTVEEAPDDVTAGKNCQPCDKVCSQPRRPGCTHPCARECHPEKCSDCEVKIPLRCHCGLLKVFLECDTYQTISKKLLEQKLSCGNRCIKMLECGHFCEKLCHGEKCSSKSSCQEKVSIKCPCGRIRAKFPCSQVCSGEVTLDCDQTCKDKEHLKIKKQKELEQEQQRKLEMEKAEKRAKELREFERFVNPVKRKAKKSTKNVDNEPKVSSWKLHFNTFLITAFSTLVLAFLIYKSIHVDN